MNKKIILIMLALLLCLGISTIASAEIGYQENANSTFCSGLIDWSNPYPCSNTIDGNWSSYGMANNAYVSYGYVYTNYTKLGTGAIWQVKDGLAEINLTIPSSCFDYDANTLILDAWSYTNEGFGWEASWECYDGSWQILRDTNQSYSQDNGKIYEEGIYWNITEAPPECINDTDCGSCQYCNSGICENQTHTDNKEECLFCEWCDGSGSCEYQEENEDIKNYCTYGNPIGTCGSPDYWTPESACNTTWTASCRDEDQIVIANGSCDGYGSCTENYPPVENGTICVDGESVLPSLTYHCGIWYDCQESQISATEYYIGYQNTSEDPSPCSDNNWQPSGNTWTAPTGYRISITEHAENCSVEAIHSGTGGAPNTPRAEVTAPTIAVASTPGISGETLAKGAIIVVSGLGVAYYAGWIGKGGSTLRLRKRRRK